MNAKEAGTLMLGVIAGVILIQMTGCGTTKPTLSAEEQNAIAALKKVEAATQVGISYMEYGKLLIDAQDRVNYVKRSQNNAVADYIFYSMEAYKDALLAWKITVTERRDYIWDFTLDEKENGLMEKYHFKDLPQDARWVAENGYPQLGTVRKDVALSIIWKHAACGLTLIDAESDKSANGTPNVLSCRKLFTEGSSVSPTPKSNP